jgi:WD40 repeat protein
MKDGAIQDLSELLRLKPMDGKALATRSYYWLDTGAFDKSIDDASAAIEIDAGVGDVFSSRGEALGHLGSYESALADLDEAIRLDPRQANTLFVRGCVHKKLGTTDQANADFEQSYQIDPSLRGRSTELAQPPAPTVAETVGHVRLFRGTTQINTVALFDNDGRALSGDNDCNVCIWDVPTGKRLFRLHADDEETVWALAVSPDAELVAWGGGYKPVDGRLKDSAHYDIKIWDLASRKELRRLRGHGGLVTDMAFCAEGQKLVSVSLDGTLRVWDVDTSAVELNLACNGTGVRSLALAPDGNTALVAGGLDHTMQLWDLKTHHKRRNFVQKGYVSCVALSPDGKLALSGSHDKTVCLWDLASGNILFTFQNARNVVNGVGFSRDGRLALAAVGGIAVNDRGHTVGGGNDNSIYMWDVRTGWWLGPLPGHRNAVMCLAVAQDGRHLLSGGSDGTMRWWHLPD